MIRAPMAAILAITATLTGCDNPPDETPPHWVQSCSRTETQFSMAPTFTPNGMVFTMVPTVYCAEYQRVCVAGKDYKGAISCN